MGLVLADYADRPDQSGHRSRPRRRRARVRCDDGDEKDRHRCNRGGAPRLKLQSSKRGSRCLTSIPVAEIALPPSAYREYPAPFDLRAYVACTWMILGVGGGVSASLRWRFPSVITPAGRPGPEEEASPSSPRD